MMAATVNKAVSGELREAESMSRHTSWRVGGTADQFFVPSDVEDLSLFLQQLDPAEPIFWHGAGSNLLVRDGGIRGVVISAAKILRDLERVDHYLVRAGRKNNRTAMNRCTSQRFRDAYLKSPLLITARG